MSAGRIVLIGLLATSAAIAAVFAIKKAKAAADGEGSTPATGGSTGGGNTGNGTVFTQVGQLFGNTTGNQMETAKILKNGSRGDEVKELQRILNKVQGYQPPPFLVVDGVFGPKTEDRLKMLYGAPQASLAMVKLKWPFA